MALAVPLLFGVDAPQVLLSRNARVYMAARSEAKATAAIEELKTSTKKDNIHWLRLDLGDLTSVRRAAEEFMEKETELHVLFNNGYGWMSYYYSDQLLANAP